MGEEIIKICERVAEDVGGVRYSYNIDTELDIENGIDSLVFMNILIEIERMYGIKLDEKMTEISKAGTIGDIVDIVCSL